MVKIPASKLWILAGIFLVYAALGIAFTFLVMNGTIARAPLSAESDEDALVKPSADLDLVRERTVAAQEFVQERLVKKNGHVDLYYLVGSRAFENHNATNSEAMSYYMLWTAKEGDKRSFDLALRYLHEHMLHPAGYLMWRLESDDTVTGDGGNIASDADLRAIKALLIAEKRWGDPKYTTMIDTLSSGLETVAVTDDGLLAPYGGGSADNPWTANEVWLSYEDFTVFAELAKRRGDPWIGIYARMKNATLGAQIANGLYNSQLTDARHYGNGIDGSGYSINSMWIMIRSAQSGDPQLRESARKSLEFYKKHYEIDAQLFSLYSSNGDPLSPSETPWVYALVGRAAVALGDEEFSDEMVRKALEFQVNDTSSPLYGAIPEGGERDRRVGQFTMQETILTLQDYIAMKEALERP